MSDESHKFVILSEIEGSQIILRIMSMRLSKMPTLSSALGVSCQCGSHLSVGRLLRQMKIDLHTHILPREWPDLDAKYGYSGIRQARPLQAVLRANDDRRSRFPRDYAITCGIRNVASKRWMPPACRCRCSRRCR